jgi:hypothetical protein
MEHPDRPTLRRLESRTASAASPRADDSPWSDEDHSDNPLAHHLPGQSVLSSRARHTSIIRSPSWKGALNDRVKTHFTVKRKIQTSVANQKRALELRSDSFRTSANCRPKRKRWSSSISTTLWGSDNLDYQPTKRHRQGTDGRDNKLWTRLNQLDPPKQRSS